MAYVHGYGAREAQRLQDQAITLAGLLHWDTVYPAGSTVLEAGCGTGAQTVTLASQSPGGLFTSIDISEASLALARKAVEAADLTNVSLLQADIFKLPFPPQSFNHAFLCFVLEHPACRRMRLPSCGPCSSPAEALRSSKATMAPPISTPITHARARLSNAK